MPTDGQPLRKPDDTGDLKRAQAAFWKAAAKLLGVLATALVPAAGVWIDASAKVKEAQAEAVKAQRAAATEKAQSEAAYVAQQEEIDKLVTTLDELAKIVEELSEADEDRGETLIRHEERINELRQRLGYRSEPVSIAGAPLLESNPLVEELMSSTKAKPPPKPARKRPEPTQERIEEIQEQYKKGAF